MNNAPTPCEYMIDVYGLRALCHLPAKKKETALAMLAEGRIRLLAMVWREFVELMPDLAEQIDANTLHKLNMKDDYRECAATIAEQGNSGFAPRPYDSYSDWYTASVCRLENLTLLTGSDNIGFYTKLDACDVEIISDAI